MSTPYLAQIEIFSFGFAPKGWAQCNGQLLPINQNPASRSASAAGSTSVSWAVNKTTP
ncbi:MAG: tail fiber protein [Rhizomicrobium sp.]